MKPIISIRSLRSLLLASSFFVAVQAFALQVIDVNEGATNFAKISAHETTRIAIEGGRIKRVFGSAGELAIEADKTLGQMFITPSGENAEKPINLFIVSESGLTYTMLLQPVEVPSEVIILKEKVKKSDLTQIEKSGDYERVIKSLMFTMANNQMPDDMQVTEKNQIIPLWNEVRFNFVRRYDGTQLIGEKYELTNTSKEEMVLAEQEFFKENVKAIAVQNHNLKPGDVTFVYVVRARRNNE